MIDLTSPKGAIVAGALALAKTQPWHDITLLDIAGAAGTTLVDVKDHFSSKAALLGFFIARVDDAVIANPAGQHDGETPRDRIFEVIMNRFDLLAPYKDALKAITADGLPDPAQVRAVFTAQHWMLQAAGIPCDGLGGGVKVAGLAGVYAAVFRVWLQDDDPGLSTTMATLDRRLRRGESTLRRMNDAYSGATGIVTSLSRFFQSGGKNTGAKDATPTGTEGPSAAQTSSQASTQPAPDTLPGRAI